MYELKNPEVKYNDMVAALIKDGSLILASLTPEKCNALHMAVGIAGEGSEMLGCFLAEGLSMFDRVNAVEEFGDMEFYVQGLIVELGITVQLPTIGGGQAYDLLRLAATVSVQAGNVLDAVKKWVVYDKPMDSVDLTTPMQNLLISLATLYGCANITREEAKDENISKLLTSEKARYKLGTYTDQQASDRQDKEVG